MSQTWGTEGQKPSPAFWDTLMDQMAQGRQLTNEEIVKFYDLWAKDQDLDKAIKVNGYEALDVLQKVMEELVPVNLRPQLTILDVGCCTGHSGQRLHELGFRNTDALDPSESSLQLAKQRGVYRALYNLPMTAEPLDFAADSYDAIVLLGVMGPAHIPVAAFTEMIRLVKPGGHIINLTRADFLERCSEYVSQWKPAIDSHVTAGRWRLVKEERYDVHYGGRPGFLHVFQIC